MSASRMSDDSSSISKIRFDFYDYTQIKDDTLDECRLLFNFHYGIWGRGVKNSSRAGQRVQFSSLHRYKCELLFDDTCHLVTASSADVIIGFAVFSTWRTSLQQTLDTSSLVDVCWVSQLVVDSKFRKMGVATELLSTMHRKMGNQYIYGLASTHCAAIKSLLHIGDIEENFMRQNAKVIVAASTVPYIRDSKNRLVGKWFSSKNEQLEPCVKKSYDTICSQDVGDFYTTGIGNDQEDCDIVSLIDTQFFVDHSEPNLVLSTIKSDVVKHWPLGNLIEGHEFLAIVLPLDYNCSKK